MTRSPRSTRIWPPLPRLGTTLISRRRRSLRSNSSAVIQIVLQICVSTGDPRFHTKKCNRPALPIPRETWRAWQRPRPRTSRASSTARSTEKHPGRGARNPRVGGRAGAEDLRNLIGIDTEKANAFARLTEKISRDEAALAKLDRDIEIASHADARRTAATNALDPPGRHRQGAGVARPRQHRHHPHLRSPQVAAGRQSDV